MHDVVLKQTEDDAEAAIKTLKKMETKSSGEKRTDSNSTGG
jgi:hypothetical protein